MAYIQPDSTILICKDIPLNASYDDTLTFYDSNGGWDYTAQYNYFSSKATTAMTKEHYSVVRERDGVLRVEGDVGLWQKVNYMVFTNKNFGGKHFYAFINKAEYVNPNTTFLYFQLDVMQTWLGDLKIENSLIEREHVEDDSLYANLEDEGIQVQERLPYDASYNFEPYIGRKMLVIGSTENPIAVEDGLVGNGFKQVIWNPRTYFPYQLLLVEYAVNNFSDNRITYNTKDTNYFRVPVELNEFSFNLVFTGFDPPDILSIYASYNKDTDKWSFGYLRGGSNETTV